MGVGLVQAVIQNDFAARVQVGTTPSNGYVLAYSASLGLWQAAAGAAPTGAASGDLGGNFPGPTVVSVANVTTGTLGATHGGTGQSTTTTGDLLVGGAANTWAKLGAGTSTYVLTSNGAGVAPSWQAAAGGASINPTTSIITIGQSLGSVPQIVGPTDADLGLATSSGLDIVATLSTGNSQFRVVGGSSTGAAVEATGFGNNRQIFGLFDQGNGLGVGPGITFGWETSPGKGNQVPGSGIRGYKTSATGSDHEGSLVFATVNSIGLWGDQFAMTRSLFLTRSDGVLGFATDTTVKGASAVAGLSLVSSGVVGVGTGAAGAVDGTLSLRTLTLNGSTSGASSWIVPATGATGTFTLPAAHGAAGTVLTDAAGNGVLSWAAGGGGASINPTTSILTIGDGLGATTQFNGPTDVDTTIQPGTPLGTAPGNWLNLYGGNGHGANKEGGNVLIIGGGASGANDAGWVILQPGNGPGGIHEGEIAFNDDRGNTVLYFLPSARKLSTTGNANMVLSAGSGVIDTTASQLKVISGVTGSGTALLGTANSPATVLSAPYAWVPFTAADGTQVYIPAWK